MQEILTEFAEMLETMEIPVANGEFLDLTECPYISFFVYRNNPVRADGIPVANYAEVEVHLITKGIRDYALEDALETLLTDNGYPFVIDYTQNIEQRVQEVTYTTTIYE